MSDIKLLPPLAPGSVARADELNPAINAMPFNEAMNYARQCVLADRAARAEMWQPIETAPKDETRIILAWGGKSVNGFYLDNSATSHPWQGWRTESMAPRPAGKPTHWMPLPDAPTQGEDE